MEMDIIDITTCTFLWIACNDKQFEYMSGTDFVCFLNLKDLENPVVVRQGEKLRVCHMISTLEQTIKPYERARGWATEILKSSGISRTYYDKHRSELMGKGLMKDNKAFVETIDTALKQAKQLASPI